eukprot:11860541-Alexandrium_andersonii.AAC.1
MDARGSEGGSARPVALVLVQDLDQGGRSRRTSGLRSTRLLQAARELLHQAVAVALEEMVAEPAVLVTEGGAQH